MLKVSEFCKSLWNEDSWEERIKEVNNFARLFLRSANIIVLATRRFIQNESPLRAAAICYSLVISFVPVVVVGMLIGARFIDLEYWFALINDTLQKNNIPVDTSLIFDLIRGFLRNAAAIGSIGILLLLFSATSVLRNIENAFNNIWRTDGKRPLLQKLSGFITVIIFGPLLITLGTTVAANLLRRFAPAELNRVKIYSQEEYQEEYIVGERALLLKKNTTERSWQTGNVISGIDFDFQNKNYIYDPKNSLASQQLTLIETNEDLYENIRIRKADASLTESASFTDMAKIEENVWIISDKGIILSSTDNGKTYHAQYFQQKIEQGGALRLKEMRLNRIVMLNRAKGIILSNGGIALFTSDSGKSWLPRKIEPTGRNLADAQLLAGNSLAVVGEKGLALISYNGGESWIPWPTLTKEFSDRKSKRDSFHFTAISSFGKSLLVAGTKGTLLVSSDFGRNWQKKYLARDIDLQAAELLSEQEGVVIGKEGTIRESRDGGKTWREFAGAESLYLNDIGCHRENGENREKRICYIAAEQSHIASFPIDLSAQLQVVRISASWQTVINALGNFILPFSIIWLLFFLVYKIIPYTPVSSRAASLGAAFTSLLWVLFASGFKTYISYFSKKTFVIYGSLAIIPVFLLLAYFSIWIMLLGAEISFLIERPLRKVKNREPTLFYRGSPAWYGLSLLAALHNNVNAGIGATTEEKLLRLCNNDRNLLRMILEKLSSQNYIAKSETSDWLPAIASKLIKVDNLLQLFDGKELLPQREMQPNFMLKIETHMKEAQKLQDEFFYGISLEEILKSRP